jgi:hypothetical protein
VGARQAFSEMAILGPTPMRHSIIVTATVVAMTGCSDEFEADLTALHGKPRQTTYSRAPPEASAPR